MARLPALSEAVSGAIAGYPPPGRRALRTLRRWLLETAQVADGVGELTETLKWGEPAWLTEASKSGSTVRIAWSPKTPDCMGVYFNCQTTLVDDFRTRWPELRFVGNRALLLPLAEPLPEDALCDCFEAALTYHLRKRRARR